MNAPSHARFSELQLVLEHARGEIVRAFTREAALAEGVPVSVAGLIADDTVQAWLALCTAGSGHERARIALLCSRRDVRARILLHGHARFSNVVASLAGSIGRGAGISYHEHGIDGWEVSLHRSLTGSVEPPPFTAAEVPVSTPAVCGGGARLSHRSAAEERCAGDRPLLPRSLWPSLRALGGVLDAPLLGQGRKR